jgi:hypothetical protein
MREKGAGRPDYLYDLPPRFISETNPFRVRSLPKKTSNMYKRGRWAYIPDVGTSAT